MNIEIYLCYTSHCPNVRTIHLLVTNIHNITPLDSSTLWTVHCKLYSQNCIIYTLPGDIHFLLYQELLKSPKAQCIVYSTLYPTLYTFHCTLYNVCCTFTIIHCTLYKVHLTVYTVHGTLCIVHCVLYTECTLCTVHCGVLHCRVVQKTHKKKKN